MRPTRRPTLVRPGLMALVSVLAASTLAGCGGGGDGKDDKKPAAAAGSSSSSRPADPGIDTSNGSPAPKGAPLPKVPADKVKPLVGKWTTSGPAKDYFVFKTDGAGSWMAKGRALWTGQVIPDGKNKFRFSWEGSDPQQSSYWGVTLNAGGKTLVFGGTNQTYTKAKAKKS